MGTGVSLMTKIMLQPWASGEKNPNNVPNRNNILPYITGELDTKYSRKVNNF
jgi:hypothetical protein